MLRLNDTSALVREGLRPVGGCEAGDKGAGAFFSRFWNRQGTPEESVQGSNTRFRKETDSGCETLADTARYLKDGE